MPIARAMEAERIRTRSPAALWTGGSNLLQLDRSVHSTAEESSMPAAAQRLRDRTAVVTGATSGIGRAIATAFAAEGAHVAIVGRDPERGAAVVAAVRAAGGRADFVAADLGAGAGALHALAASATQVLGGRVDVLVNNAGIYPSPPTVDVDEAAFWAMIATNLQAPFVLTQALVPAMLARGDGTIINIGSWIAGVGMARGALYGATKAALEQLTRAWAAEYGSSGVRVNAIAPGITLTEGSAGAKAILDAMVLATPAGRTGRPEEIADAAVYLASDAASFVQGSTLLVDGGALNARVAA
jgi:NAD(P)-dependent dehydrogenase (short-subunit alcohol dehydrogenase family)